MACRRDRKAQAQPKSSQPPSTSSLARSCPLAPSFLRKQESLCSALDPCFRRDGGAVLLASPKTRGAQVSVRRLGCEREARERPMDGRRSDFRGHGGSSE